MAREQREGFVSMVTLMFSVLLVIFSMPVGWLAHFRNMPKLRPLQFIAGTRWGEFL